jgi:curved DNA-binding protein CbpA
MPDGFDPYKTLQVDPEADPEVIQAAYRRLAQKFHPDVASGREATDRMIAINRAWEMVGDPVRRASYDRDRTSRGSPPPISNDRTGSAGPSASSESSAPGGPSASPASSGTSSGTSGATPRPRPPEEVSRDWTSGRSTAGFAYDPGSMRTPDGQGAAGVPPGHPSGSTLNFGRYDGWSLGEIARVDLEYLEWLDRMPIGRPYRDEIDAILRRTGRRRSAAADATDRRGLFRRR